MTDKDKIELAFLGMGIMGASMASNLARAGKRVRIWNRTKGKPLTKAAIASGCIESQTISQCVSPASIIFTCLGDVEDVESILIGANGVSSFAKPNSIVVDFSTIGPSAAKLIAKALDSSGIKFLDAPITGGDIGAQNGTLTIMVGGEKEAYSTVLPYLMTMGKNVQLCGPVGAGQSLKLCNQVLCAVNMSAVSEAIHLAKDFGIEPSLVVHVLKDGAGGSWALSNLGARIVKDDLKPGFMLKHMLKDLRLVHENQAKGAGKLPSMELAESMFKQIADSENKAGEIYGTQAMIKVYDK